MTPQAQTSSLARYLLLCYGLLVVYASLHPFSGWAATGVAPFAFVAAPIPRTLLRYDFVANILGYAPLGFLAALSAYPRLRGARACAAATAAALVLSFALEALQSYLPSRTPSNVDWAANSLGGIAGALLGVWFSDPLLEERGFKAARYRIFRAGRRIDIGLVLIALWLFIQLDPQILLFGGGDLRVLFQDPPPVLHPAEVFIRAEALVAGANSLVIALIISLLVAPGQRPRTLFAATLALALALHALAYATFFGRGDALNWATPGALIGTIAGVVVALAAAALSRPAQLALCALAIMAAAVVVNIAPTNPYLAASLATWHQGYFEHFIGLTRLIAGAWPFLALAYVVWLASVR